MTGLPRPSGTVTFLFTDIEGSTRRWELDPDAMQVELAAHDDVLRAAIESNGGWLFKHTGDGVCAAFSSASGAVAAAIDAQHALQLPVRMGVGTGSTVYGISTHGGSISMVIGLATLLDDLRSVLGPEAFDAAVATGAGMPYTDAVQYARREIDRAARELGATS